MKRIASIVMLMTAIALLWTGSIIAQEHKGPRILIKEERHDFGKVAQGAQAMHVFTIQNTGDEILEIQKVQSS